MNQRLCFRNGGKKPIEKPHLQSTKCLLVVVIILKYPIHSHSSDQLALSFTAFTMLKSFRPFFACCEAMRRKIRHYSNLCMFSSILINWRAWIHILYAIVMCMLDCFFMIFERAFRSISTWWRKIKKSTKTRRRVWREELFEISIRSLIGVRAQIGVHILFAYN